MTRRRTINQEDLRDAQLIDLNARLYDPELGKFLSPDPIIADISDSQAWNPYDYAANNPMSREDPTGLQSVTNVKQAEAAQLQLENSTSGAFGGCFGNCGAQSGRVGSGSTGGPAKSQQDGVRTAQNNTQTPSQKSLDTSKDTEAAPNDASRPSTSSLRRAWEKANGQPWPKDPKTGKNQDAAHIKARADGGSDEPHNIKPQPHDEHIQEHQGNGDFRRWGARGGSRSPSGNLPSRSVPESAPGTNTTKLPDTFNPGKTDIPDLPELELPL